MNGYGEAALLLKFARFATPTRSPEPQLGRNRQSVMMEIELNHRVSTALECNPHLSRRNLRFENNQGRVVLLGIVDSYYQKQMAQEALRHVEGVREISNQLEVSWA
jgi:hypothetical protein